MAEKKESLPTQEFIGIKSIANEVITLNSGALRKILLVSGINFSLKSEEEQGLITYAFQGFLNSLDFSIQMFIHSRKLNIEEYLEKLESRESQEENSLLKNQILEYREFIRSLVAQNAIMQKTFFIVVPYDPLNLPGAGLAVTDKILEWFKSKPELSQTKTENTDEALEQLEQRTDRIIQGVNQIGLRAIALNDDELIELFYNLYNPATTEKKGIDINTEIKH